MDSVRSQVTFYKNKIPRHREKVGGLDARAAPSYLIHEGIKGSAKLTQKLHLFILVKHFYMRPLLWTCVSPPLRRVLCRSRPSVCFSASVTRVCVLSTEGLVRAPIPRELVDVLGVEVSGRSGVSSTRCLKKARRFCSSALRI